MTKVHESSQEVEAYCYYCDIKLEHSGSGWKPCPNYHQSPRFLMQTKPIDLDLTTPKFIDWIDEMKRIQIGLCVINSLLAQTNN